MWFSWLLFQIEEEVCLAIERQQLTLVGWYHSHPSTPSEPSLGDIHSQVQYQNVLADDESGKQPCVGFVVSPYWPRPMSRESALSAFWVKAIADTHGQPMQLHVSLCVCVFFQSFGFFFDKIYWLHRQVYR